jgi:TatD DNase family protein
VIDISEAVLIDTHCHLDFSAFENDRLEVLERAKKAGLTRIINPGINISTSFEAVNLSEKYPEVYAAVGIHPNDATSWNEGSFDQINNLTKHPKVVAIGEIGLDYYRDQAPRELQRQLFREQLRLAKQNNLPVIIHSRQASSDILSILIEWIADLKTNHPRLALRPGVLHSFSGDLDTAWQAIELNFKIGITGPVTFHNASKLQQIVTAIPLTHLLVETDAPFLTPHPHRGLRNEPAYVRLVIDKIAELHKQPFTLVAETITQNATMLFNWREQA